ETRRGSLWGLRRFRRSRRTLAAVHGQRRGKSLPASQALVVVVGAGNYWSSCCCRLLGPAVFPRSHGRQLFGAPRSPKFGSKTSPENSLAMPNGLIYFAAMSLAGFVVPALLPNGRS